MREYHALRSMQPMFTIQSSDSSSFTSGAWISRVRRGASRVVALTGTRLIHSGIPRGASFWKKKSPCQPSG